MATAEISVVVSNVSVDICATSDTEDNVVVYRKSRNKVLLSDDDEDDGNISLTEINIEKKEVGDSDEQNMYKSLTDPSNIVKETMNLVSTVETAILKSQVAGDDVKLQSINNNISKNVNKNAAESESDLLSSRSSPNISPAKDVESSEKPHGKLKRFTNILDSDSEDEGVSSSLVNNKISPSGGTSQDSRSSSPDSDYLIQRKDGKKAGPGRKPRRMANSDSEDEKGSADEREISMDKKSGDISSSLKSTGNNSNTSKPNKISELIDSDSEEDNPTTQKFQGSSDEGEPTAQLKTVEKKGKTEKKKRTGSIRAAKEEAMREIHSESQRMLRESQVRLPYHRPRQRTLQEFLNRRKDLPTLPATLTTAVKMKMSGEIVGKVLEEKEKEAELFYKSSSDSDNEGGTRTETTATNVKPKSIVGHNIENVSTIEETQKIIRNEPKNSQGVKEVIQQGEKSLGLPRKLFNCPENEAEAIEARSPPVENDFGETTKENQDCNQRHKEFKQGLKDVSVPRILFGSECIQPMEMDHEQVSRDREGNDEIEKVPEICETNNSKMRVLNKSNQFVENEMIDMSVTTSEGQRNESMEEEGEDFELKMSEDPCGMTNDKPALHDAVIPKTSTITAFESITETPFISNRELSKLNEKETTDLGEIVADTDLASNDKIKSKETHLGSAGDEHSLFINSESSCNTEDSEDKNEPFGHVYGLPLPEFDDNKSKKINTRILPDIMRLTPRLQGSPDMVIELSPPKVGVNHLIKRFLNHSVAKKKPESSPEVSTIRTEQTASGVIVVNEVLPYRIPINEKNDDPELSKPGAKLVRLKEDLQHQMAIQRIKEREKKEQEMKSLDADNVYRDERSDCGIEEENDVEEDEEEELSSDGESEPDENDLPVKEAKKKYKSPFVDAEAEVSGEESEEEGEGDRENEDSDSSFNGDCEDEEDEESETRTIQKNKTGKLKRITKAFEDEDSNDSEVKEASDSGKDRHFQRKRTDLDMFATDNNSDDDWLSGTEGDLPVYQQRMNERSQSCATPSVANNSLSIVSPITQLTALNTGSESVNLDSRSSQNPSQFMAPLSVETTPIEAKSYRECNSEKREKLQKKLFDDIKDTPNDAELMGLCSGQFPNSPSEIRELNQLMHTARETNVSDTELLDLCSGTFATQPADINELEAGSQKAQSVFKPLSINSLPSPDKSTKEQSHKADRISSTVRIVSSSDEEDDMHNPQVQNPGRNKLKKKVRRLTLSDDEKESDNDSLSGLDEGEDGEEKFVDYDSEENEIVVAKKDIKKVAARFLDEEAELSESEWGSADEDERDLDKLDAEEGDLEDIDQDQVKNQLEKMHMRQVLDADQREVRLLQEILLEDGELHSDSASRQRKFKWKNIDELREDSENHSPCIDEEGLSVDPNDAESELEWHKQRLEREQFLQEQRVKDAAAGVEEETEDSQLLQLGLKALKKNKNTKVPSKDVSQSIVPDHSQMSIVRHTVADLFASPGCGKKTFALQNAIHRGSFLARGEESLARLSAMTKQNSDHAIIRSKKSRNFVFTHLSPAIEALVENEELDGQENTITADTKLRKRKPTFSLTPVASKKSKKEYQQTNTRSKLFN